MYSPDSQRPHPGSEVTLREITEESLDAILGLQVGEHQRKLVADNARSIPQAHFRRTRGLKRSTLTTHRWALSCCGTIRTNRSTTCGA